VPARSVDGSLRGWPAQLAQWALVFGALGLIIVGAKWWDREVNGARPAPPTVAAAELDAG